MDPVQSTASQVILDTVPDAAEQKSESSRLGGRILRACRPACCSVQTDESAEPDKKPREKSTSKPPEISAPTVSVSETSALASQNKPASDTAPETPASTNADTSPETPASTNADTSPETPASTDADTSPPANVQPGGHQRTGSIDSGAGSFTTTPGS